MTDDRTDGFPGSDPIDNAVENIIPPSSPPMDDAAGGPQAEESDAVDNLDPDAPGLDEGSVDALSKSVTTGETADETA